MCSVRITFCELLVVRSRFLNAFIQLRRGAENILYTYNCVTNWSAHEDESIKLTKKNFCKSVSIFLFDFFFSMRPFHNINSSISQRQ